MRRRYRQTQLQIQRQYIIDIGLIYQAATGGHLVKTGPHIVIAWWYRPLQYLVVTAYFVVSWLRGGQTLGMRPWRMQLRMTRGGRVRLTAALIRAAAMSLPLLLLSLGHTLSPRTTMLALLAVWALFYAVALFDPRRRALHDIVAGTELVHTVAPRRKYRAGFGKNMDPIGQLFRQIWSVFVHPRSKVLRTRT